MNAAGELALLLTQWNKPLSKTFYVRRGLESGSPADYEFWQMQRKAIELLVETENSMEALGERNISLHTYRPMLTRIWAYAFSPEIGWQSASPGNVIAVGDIHLLETMSHLLDALGANGPQLSEENREALLALLDDVVGEVEGCFDLPQSIRVRLASHVQYLRDLLDPDGDIDPRKLQQLLDQMGGLLLNAMYETADPDKKHTFLVSSVAFVTALSQNAAYDGVKSVVQLGFQKLLGLPAGE